MARPSSCWLAMLMLAAVVVVKADNAEAEPTGYRMGEEAPEGAYEWDKAWDKSYKHHLTAGPPGPPGPPGTPGTDGTPGIGCSRSYPVAAVITLNTPTSFNNENAPTIVDPTCGDAGGLWWNTIWFSFQPETGGIYFVDTCDSVAANDRPTLMLVQSPEACYTVNSALLSGNPSCSPYLTWNSPGSEAIDKCVDREGTVVAFEAVAGATYHIAVASPDVNQAGTGTITVSNVPTREAKKIKEKVLAKAPMAKWSEKKPKQPVQPKQL